MHAVAVALLAIVPLVAPVDTDLLAPQHHKFLSLPEILKRMEASPVRYQVNSLADLKDTPPNAYKELLWPKKVEPVGLPRVRRGASGRVDISEWTTTPEAGKAMGEAEELFGQKDFAAAAEKYRAAIAADADYYLAYASLGDCLLFTRDAKGALAQYEKALKLNPDDYRLYFFRGNALAALGRKAEAVEDYVTSLVLKPRNPILLSNLRKGGPMLGVEVQDELLNPRAFVRTDGGGVTLYVDTGNPHWLGWASCKAFWLGEASHRKEMLGEAEVQFSTLEEMECLAALVTAHLGMAEKNKVKPDPAMKRLENVIEDGLAGAFAVYELGSRLDPQIALRIDKKHYPALRRYVRKYVLGLSAQ